MNEQDLEQQLDTLNRKIAFEQKMQTEVNPCLERLQKGFKINSPKQYARSLRTVFDELTLKLIEERNENSHMAVPLIDLREMIYLLEGSDD